MTHSVHMAKAALNTLGSITMVSLSLAAISILGTAATLIGTATALKSSYDFYQEYHHERRTKEMLKSAGIVIAAIAATVLVTSCLEFIAPIITASVISATLYSMLPDLKSAFKHYQKGNIWSNNASSFSSELKQQIQAYNETAQEHGNFTELSLISGNVAHSIGEAVQAPFLTLRRLASKQFGKVPFGDEAKARIAYWKGEQAHALETIKQKARKEGAAIEEKVNSGALLGAIKRF